MTHVIVHPGFHKTGTSSLQGYLLRNRATLAPYLQYYGKADFQRAGTAARIYAMKPYPWRLRAFRRHFDVFLTGTPDAPVIVLSRETFSGEMPGNPRPFGPQIRSYDGTAQRLARQIAEALRARYGPDTRITFLYTLREREPWIRSIYGHLLRSTRLTDDYETFRRRLRKLATPEAQAHKIARDLRLEVMMIHLEEASHHREGPAFAVLDLAGVPEKVRATLPAASCENAGQPADLDAGYLAMNRASRSGDTLQRRKEAMRRGG